MKTIALATFHELEPERVLRDRLQQAGFPAIIHNESKLQRFWFMSSPLAAVHVEVPQPDYLQARKVVDDLDRSDKVLSDAVRCPECHSSWVEFPQMPRKFIGPTNLVTLLMILRIVEREFYCHNCHYTWPVAERIDSARDIRVFPMSPKLCHPAHHHGRH